MNNVIVSLNKLIIKNRIQLYALGCSILFQVIRLFVIVIGFTLVGCPISIKLEQPKEQLFFVDKLKCMQDPFNLEN